MSILPDPALTPLTVPHPTWCDPRRCHVYIRGDGLEPLLVHEGEHQKLMYRSVVLMQCQVLSDDLTHVASTCSPMVCVDGAPIDHAPFRPDRARVWGDVLHAADVAADRGALPFVQEAWKMGGVW